MCGIFCYLGRRGNAPKIVFDGLKRLEYRGYDSWGLAINSKFKTNNLKLLVEKHVGKISNSSLDSKLLSLNSNLAIGHTRWATHGGVTKLNAHPHLACNGRLALIHNGIVENYQPLKKDLLSKHKFLSDTDTEVIVHLIEEELHKSDLKEAVRTVFNQLEGLNAIACANSHGEIVAAKNGSPLVIGIGKNEYFLSSDATALLPYTRKVVFLEDGQLVAVNKDGFVIYSLVNGKRVRPKTQSLNWEIAEVNRGKFAHFMIKEIYEQPKVVRNIAQNYADQLQNLAGLIKKAKGTFLIGCGSASYAALAGQYLFSRAANVHVNFAIGSEFNYLEHYLAKKSLVIAISQSGETIDVVEPVSNAKKRGAKIVAMTNVLGSTLYRLADHKILLGAGPEMAVCATKSFIAMVAQLYYLANLMNGQPQMAKSLLLKAADNIELILQNNYLAQVRKLVEKLYQQEHIYIIGRGLSYAAALEATLKLKEVPYIHSEGFAGGELKHGVIALIEKGTPTVVFAPNDETKQAIISNAVEIKARGGYIIGIGPEDNEVFDYYLPLLDLADATIIPGVVVMQLLAYYLALRKGLEPDKPRNLAKSVTVK